MEKSTIAPITPSSAENLQRFPHRRSCSPIPITPPETGVAHNGHHEDAQARDEVHPDRPGQWPRIAGDRT